VGLSIAISGCIVTFSIVYVMMTFPAIVDETTKISTSSAQMSSTLNAIMHTNIEISNLQNAHDDDTTTFSVNNTGNTILWNYKEFDVIITYQANTEATPKLTEVLNYANSCTALASDHWCIQSITNDLIHPGMLDPKETANIQAKLQNPTNQGGTLTLNFGTDNGVMDTRSVKIT
jgi:archaellum component FlaF (FlaF/FlaG flagellin family)